ncbi:MAG: enolase C-terminal domain-like protein [Haloechinothrix sp.]
MRIAAVEIISLYEPRAERPRDWWSTTPLDVLYSEETHHLSRRQPGAEARGSVSNVIVQVHTDEGLSGLGTVGVGSPAAAPVIEHHLAPLLLGQNPFDVEMLWQTMYRHTLNMGRKGLVLEAISALDIALWDILGKATGQPVYNLLGGRTRDAIRCYASELYAREDLGTLTAEAKSYVEQGFTAVKMRFGYGPNDGRVGMRRNYDLVATVRDAVGPDVDVMGEAYMGWDTAYAVAMIRMVEEFELAWVEEPVLPDAIEAYAHIRRSVSTPISGGEHEFTLAGFHQLLRQGAVDVVQPDVNRMGGITEARKVWALAQAYGVPVVPHSQQAHNAHLVIASLQSPLLEIFPDNEVRTGYKFFTEFFEGEPQATNGVVHLSDTPGLGIVLNEDVVERHRAGSVRIGDSGA